jgi:2-methylcitrate dehydratase
MAFDGPTILLADFATSARYEDLSDGEIGAVVRHNLDTVGCGLGALRAEPVQIARSLARTAVTPVGCSAFGIAEPVVPEYAAFANTAAIRNLDYNDSYTAPGGGHPSDMLPAIVAAGEFARAPGRTVVLGMHVGYEVFAALAETYDLRNTGWDHIFIGVGAAVGAGVVFGLDAEAMGNAISLALTPCMPMRSNRAGELSMWKGVATAHLGLTGLLAARLAQGGMAGPHWPFEEINGLNKHIPPLKELVVGEPQHGRAIFERSNYKFYPAEYNSQALITAFLAVRDQVKADDIKQITIETFHRAWDEIGGGGGDHDAKWNPTTRETADHSLPYIVALTLIDGDITWDSFEPSRYSDPTLRPLMERISVSAREDLSAMWPYPPRSEVTIDFNDGRVIEFAAEYALGHWRNPMTDEQLSEKFQHLAARYLPADISADLESALWRLADLPAVTELTDLYRRLEVDA